MATSWNEGKCYPISPRKTVKCPATRLGPDWKSHALRGLAEKAKVKMALDKCILYLDEKFAKLPDDEETVCVQKAIEEAVSALVRSVGEQDARFLGKIEPSGSFYEGTKILQPDEFDFVVTLSRLSEFCDIVYRGGAKTSSYFGAVLSTRKG